MHLLQKLWDSLRETVFNVVFTAVARFHTNMFSFNDIKLHFCLHLSRTATLQKWTAWHAAQPAAASIKKWQVWETQVHFITSLDGDDGHHSVICPLCAIWPGLDGCQSHICATSTYQFKILRELQLLTLLLLTSCLLECFYVIITAYIITMIYALWYIIYYLFNHILSLVLLKVPYC